jgi:hypothetical protein
MKPQQKKAEKQSSGKALNIRNFPTDVFWSCKAAAAQQRQNLREFVIETLRKASATT